MIGQDSEICLILFFLQKKKDRERLKIKK